MDDRSSGNLFQPLKVGNGHIATLTDLMWPTYRRVTDEKGGDLYSDFVIDSAVHDVDVGTLERWFINWIGCHFEETFGGRDAYQGLVNTLRLHIGGVVLVHSLDQMYNSVRVSYQPDSSSAASVTSAATDTGSIDRYGTKEYIFEPRSFLTQTHAEAKRDAFLARHKLPFIESGDVSPRGDNTAVLEVYTEGYISTLDWKYYNLAAFSAGADTLSAHIENDLLNSLDFVSVGDIETISTSITDEADYITHLRRIDDLLADSGYYYGCIAGRSFDLKARDESNVKYTRRAFGRRGGIWQNGVQVPAPLVKPSGIIWTEDIYAGRPVDSTLLNDVRSSWIAQVEYSRDGVQLKNGEQPDEAWDAGNQALVMAKDLNIAADIERKNYITNARAL